MTPTEIETAITRLTQRRQDIWAGAPSEPGEVQKIGKALADLFEQRRIRNAQSPGYKRSDVIRRARVESELERLMSR